MRVLSISLIPVNLFSLLVFPAVAFASPGDGGNSTAFAAEEILVKFKPNIGPSDIAKMHRQYGGQVPYLES